MEKITLNVQEVAAMLGVSKPTIYRLVKANQIPYFKMGGKLYFNKELIIAFTRGEVQAQNS